MSASPNPAQLRLLQAALLDGAPATQAWTEWCAKGPSIDDLDPYSYRLLPQLYRNAQALGLDGPAMPRLKGIYRHTWYTNQRLMHAAARALTSLQEAGIETIVLKGGALLTLYHDDHGVRPMRDVDLLVRPDDAQRALRLLEGLGWLRKKDRPLAELMRITHGTPLLHRARHVIDLHWSPLSESGAFPEIWEGAVPAAIQDAPTHAPSAADQLLLACAHALGWSAAPVYWICDALLIVREAGDGLDWEKLVSNAQGLGVTPELTAALTHLADQFALPVPDDALRELRETHLGPADRFIQRVKTSTGQDRSRARLLRLATWRWDVARRLRARPHSQFGAPRGMLDYLREYWDLPSRRAAVRHLARIAARTVRGAEPEPTSASPRRAPTSPGRVHATSPTAPGQERR